VRSKDALGRPFLLRARRFGDAGAAARSAAGSRARVMRGDFAPGTTPRRASAGR